MFSMRLTNSMFILISNMHIRIIRCIVLRMFIMIRRIIRMMRCRTSCYYSSY